MKGHYIGQPNSGNGLAIETKDLGKCYRIYEKPKERLKQALFRNRRRYYKEFWALRNVSFKLEKGESLGIIGRNGSGKSTLLQMICGTLSPTEGSVQTTGRIAALLELGSGFNPEFTGLENVYLNASLLGLSKRQTEERLDAILSFADIGDFVEQPVKAYSSGMVVRLAFGVIANADPEILVVDEALAVGDAIFTQKCMRFIHQVREHQSLLFVSHDPTSVAALCDKCLWIEKGQVRLLTETRKALNGYLQSCYSEVQETVLPPSRGYDSIVELEDPMSESASLINDQEASAGSPTHPAIRNPHHSFSQSRNISSNTGRSSVPEDFSGSYGDGAILIETVELVQAGRPELPASPLNGGEVLLLMVKARCQRRIERPSICGFNLVNDKGLILFGENTFIPDAPSAAPLGCEGDELEARFMFTMPPLKPGAYFINIAWASGTQNVHTQHHYINAAIQLNSTAHLCRPVMGLFACDIHDISIINTCQPLAEQANSRTESNKRSPKKDNHAAEW
jgi:lipopolysaccharide transport system ATP-binding protein